MHSQNQPAGQPSLHRIFEDVVRRTPTAIALEGDGQRLSYDQLNRRANRLARRLRQEGLRVGDPVGIHLPRSVALVVAVLAASKAGGCFVAIADTWPEARRMAVVRASKARIAITHTADDSLLPIEVAVVDAMAERADERDDNLELSLPPGAAAYCIYTSGSTGIPKGVVVGHAGLGALARAQVRWFAPAPQDRVWQFASFGFDAFVFELLLAFVGGSTLVVSQRDAALTLARSLIADDVTIATLTPSLVATADLRTATSLRTLICAGERYAPGTRDRTPVACRIFNAYGPTEASIWATVAEVTAPEPVPVPIGHGIAGTTVLLCNARLEPVGVDAVGEICIGGPGLAHGYLGMPGATASAFLPNPFGPPGSRLYRTGDLGRQRDDGAIEYLGRNDEQIKLHGHRIELGEVEAAIESLDGVRRACVVTIDDALRGPQLGAYVVAHDDLADWRATLAARLPAAMVPAFIERVDALPRTTNGKVDRNALAERARRPVGQIPAAAAEGTFARVAAHWRHVLGVAECGDDDHFFQRGGTSMLLIALRAAIEADFRIALPVAEFYRSPTLGGLVAQVDALKDTAGAAAAAPLQGRERRVLRRRPMATDSSRA